MIDETNTPRTPSRANTLAWSLAALLVGAVGACDVTTGPRQDAQEASSLSRSEASAERIHDASSRVRATVLSDSHDGNADFSQIVFIDKPEGVSGATSTSMLETRFGGFFTTVYNTIGSSLTGAITFGRLRDGRVRGAYDVTTGQIEFSEAQVRDVGGRPRLLVSGGAATDGDLDIQTPAIFMTSDLRRSTTVFDLPGTNGSGFDFVTDDEVAVATGTGGSISLLDPFDSDSVRTVAEGLSSLLGLDAASGSIHVTDASGVIRTYDRSGSQLDSIPLPNPLNAEERAEVSVCGELTLVGAHTSGVRLIGGGTQVLDAEFGIGASMGPNCSALAATTEGSVLVGVANGSGDFDVYRLDSVGDRPLPYASSVEIVPLENSRGLVDDASADYLLAVSSADGTHFITVAIP